MVSMETGDFLPAGKVNDIIRKCVLSVCVCVCVC